MGRRIIMAKKQDKFEDNLKKLESIVENLEIGNLDLDESLKAFEQGIKLVKVCQKKLEGAERTVEKLIKDDKGDVKTSNFEE
jgi:exodeoxyribonuclease VII small subunit